MVKKMGVFYLLKHMRNQLLRVSLASRTLLAAEVDEVIRIIVPLGHDMVLGVVEQRQELVVETLLAFLGELVPETPHARAKDGPEIIHVLSRRHPIKLPGSVKSPLPKPTRNKRIERRCVIRTIKQQPHSPHQPSSQSPCSNAPP